MLMDAEVSAAALRPATVATVCHSASVMKGVMGCAKRRMVSKVRIKVRRVARFWASSPTWICTLAISKYQSQNSFHTKS